MLELTVVIVGLGKVILKVDKDWSERLAHDFGLNKDEAIDHLISEGKLIVHPSALEIVAPKLIELNETQLEARLCIIPTVSRGFHDLGDQWEKTFIEMRYAFKVPMGQLQHLLQLESQEQQWEMSLEIDDTVLDTLETCVRSIGGSERFFVSLLVLFGQWRADHDPIEIIEYQMLAFCNDVSIPCTKLGEFLGLVYSFFMILDGKEDDLASVMEFGIQSAKRLYRRIGRLEDVRITSRELLEASPSILSFYWKALEIVLLTTSTLTNPKVYRKQTIRSVNAFQRVKLLTALRRLLHGIDFAQVLHKVSFEDVLISRNRKLSSHNGGYHMYRSTLFRTEKSDVEHDVEQKMISREMFAKIMGAVKTQVNPCDSDEFGRMSVKLMSYFSLLETLNNDPDFIEMGLLGVLSLLVLLDEEDFYQHFATFFKIFDEDDDGLINQTELLTLIQVLITFYSHFCLDKQIVQCIQRSSRHWLRIIAKQNQKSHLSVDTLWVILHQNRFDLFVFDDSEAVADWNQMFLDLSSVMDIHLELIFECPEELQKDLPEYSYIFEQTEVEAFRSVQKQLFSHRCFENIHMITLTKFFKGCTEIIDSKIRFLIQYDSLDSIAKNLFDYNALSIDGFPSKLKRTFNLIHTYSDKFIDFEQFCVILLHLSYGYSNPIRFIRVAFALFDVESRSFLPEQEITRYFECIASVIVGFSSIPEDTPIHSLQLLVDFFAHSATEKVFASQHWHQCHVDDVIRFHRVNSWFGGFNFQEDLRKRGSSVKKLGSFEFTQRVKCIRWRIHLLTKEFFMEGAVFEEVCSVRKSVGLWKFSIHEATNLLAYIGYELNVRRHDDAIDQFSSNKDLCTVFTNSGRLARFRALLEVQHPLFHYFECTQTSSLDLHSSENILQVIFDEVVRSFVGEASHEIWIPFRHFLAASAWLLGGSTTEKMLALLNLYDTDKNHTIKVSELANMMQSIASAISVFRWRNSTPSKYDLASWDAQMKLVQKAALNVIFGSEAVSQEHFIRVSECYDLIIENLNHRGVSWIQVINFPQRAL